MAGTAFDPPRPLDQGWSRASAPAGEGPCPSGLEWRPAEPVPRGADGLDHWFRLDEAVPPGSVIEFRGLATWTEVWLDGVLVARHRTMFRPLPVPVPGGASRIEVCARALRAAPGSPRPRWRNRLVAGEGLRNVRTSLAGRIPGTGEPAVGPYRPVLLHRGMPLRRRVRAWLEDGDGVVEVRLAGAVPEPERLLLHACGERSRFAAVAGGLVATVRVRRPELWWPHTHGAPRTYDTAVEIGGGRTVSCGKVGFRTVARAPGPGLRLVVNGVPVFCRGAVWSGEDGPALRQARAAGLNMVRVAGTGAYPEAPGTAAEGMLLWQDFMFSRFDYPLTPEFVQEVREEVRHVLDEMGGDPSLVVLCGGEEVAQAAAMAGRPAAEWDHALFDRVIAEEVAALRPDVVYVPNAPHGGVPPFAASAEVSHYFGVGAYQRPLHEARGVRFAAACLAFSNPPDAEGCRAISATPGDAGWAAAVPRDPGASWTFEDARDHYAAGLLGADMAGLRRTDPERWLAMGRAGVALAMQASFVAWRTDPGCGGALVLELQDGRPGAGWGLIDHAGRVKSAFHAVAQVSAPLQVLLRDEGMDGVVAYVLNDGEAPCAARLRLRGLGPSGEAEWLGAIEMKVPGRGRAAYAASAIMGRFVDLAGTWRFGPAPYRVLGAVLDRGEERVSETTLFLDPALPRERVGLTANVEERSVLIGAARFAQFVAVDAGPLQGDRDHFHLWPGEAMRVAYVGDAGVRLAGTVTALNGLDAAHFSARG